jgi:nitrile hydratase accessory protein
VAECRTLTEDDVTQIRGTSARPVRQGDEAFRVPWELRSFALGVAVHESEDFPWTDFQSALVTAIDAAQDGNEPEHYYARWVEALETLLRERGGLDVAELDRRTQQILDTPRDDGHTHPHHDGPVAVAHPHADVTTTHDHDHGHD